MDFEKVGAHLANASSSYDRAFRRFEKIQDRISTLGHKEQPLLSESVPQET